LKIASIAAVLFLVLGAVVFVYASSQNSLNASGDEQQTYIQNVQTYCRWNNDTTLGHMRNMPRMQANDLQWVTTLFQNATTSTVQGTVVSQLKGILILDTGSGQIRVLVPKEWSINNEVVSRASLFNGTFASPGQTVTVKVLKSDIVSNANLSINLMLGYEAINAAATQAYAVLPFNIQPAS